MTYTPSHSPIDQAIQAESGVPIDQAVAVRLEYERATDIATEDEHYEDELIERVLMKHGTSVLYGASNSGKTFLAIDMACAIALEKPWLGQRTEGGVVVYLATEAAGSVLNRIKAYKLRHDVTELNLFVVKSPINFFNKNDHPEQVALLIKQVERDTGQKCVLVIGDTMARMAAGANENAGQDMGTVMDHAEMIKHTCGVHFLWIHHCGKDAARGMRGWSGILAAIDTEIEVSEEKGTRTRTVEITKQRDGEGKGDRYAFTLESVKIGENRWGVDRNSCVVVPADGFNSTLPLVNQADISKREGVVLKILLDNVAPMKRGEIVEAADPLGLKKSQVYDAIYNLLRARKVFEIDRHITLERGEI